MGRKGTLVATIMMIVVLSAGLAGGQVGGERASTSGFLWWGDHEPIYIYGDCDFTVENGVMSGCGTAADPYVIEGWRIDAPRADYGIYIDHTTKHFVIRDCVIERARIAGVYLNTVANGCNRVQRCALFSCRYGVVMAGMSSGNRIFENSFLECGLNAQDMMRSNAWCDAGRGNYWSDFCGLDCDGNGICDLPNYRYGDPCPLASPPVEWTGISSAGPTYSGNWIAPDGSLVVTSETPIELRAADMGAGLAEIRYAIDCGAWMTYTEDRIYLIGEDGPRRVDYYGIDNLGNVERRSTVFFFLDNHPPVTVHEIGDPVYVNEERTWVTSKTPIILRRTQESTYGRTRTFFRIDGRNWQEYCGPFVLYAADGPHQVSYYSRNASGVTEEVRCFVLYKDDAPPTTRGGRGTTTPIEVRIGDTSDGSTEPEPVIEPEPEPEVQTPAAGLDAEPGIEDDAGESAEPGVQTPSGTG